MVLRKEQESRPPAAWPSRRAKGVVRHSGRLQVAWPAGDLPGPMAVDLQRVVPRCRGESLRLAGRPVEACPKAVREPPVGVKRMAAMGVHLGAALQKAPVCHLPRAALPIWV